MEDLFEKQQIEQFKVELQTNGAAAAAAMIDAYLAEQDNIPLNIGITGESGSGKSTFVNAFRGLDKKDKSAAAAPTGCTETTMEVKPYPHPQHPNVTLWDLPGVGTPNFQAEDYLKLVQFERFDFFIIISADRFRENDVKLAKEIQRMEKKFYFVRSKIDQDMKNEEETQSEFNAENVLTKIRNNCVQGLEKQDVDSPKVFLVSSHHLHLYDFLSSLLNLRLCESDSGKMVSVLDLPSNVLIVPQATLGGKVKGRAMQYHNNIGKEDGKRLYDAFVSLCEKEVTSEEVTVKHGTYGNRQVLNMDTNGPYTHLMEF